MKTVILIFLVIFSSITLSKTKDIYFGIYAGPTLISLNGNSLIESYPYRISFAAGLNFEYILNNYLSIQSSVGFERKGLGVNNIDLQDNGGNFIGKGDAKSNFDYITLPILVSFSTPGDSNDIKYYACAGPFIGFLIGQNEIKTTTDFEIENQFKGFEFLDFGFCFGIGTKIPLNETYIFDIGLKYNFGLINTSKVSVIDDGSIKTSSIGLLISLKYKL